MCTVLGLIQTSLAARRQFTVVFQGILYCGLVCMALNFALFADMLIGRQIRTCVNTRSSWRPKLKFNDAMVCHSA